MTANQRALRVAIEAAQEAARLIRAQAGDTLEGNIWEKGTKDLVTATDEAAQATIIRTLEEAFPDWGFMAEEAAEQASYGTTRWIIDPIDGTVNFAHGLAPFAVSIALEIDQQLQAGVVLEVASGDLFTAIRGGGAWRNGAPIAVSERPRLASAIVATGFPFKEFGSMKEYLEVLSRFMVEARGVRRFGAASVDLAYVAAGLIDGFFETGLHAWDIAAGMLLVQEAGGRCTDFNGEHKALSSGHIVATNGWVHEEMLQLMMPLSLHVTRRRR